MGLKKSENYRGIDLAEAHYDIIAFKAELITLEDETNTWRIIVKVAMYSNADKIALLERPPVEYVVGNIDNSSQINYSAVNNLLKQQDKFIDAVDA